MPGRFHKPWLRRTTVAALLVGGALRLHAQEDLSSVLNRAQVEQNDGRYSQAAADYARATTLDLSNPELWANRGVMEYLAGEFNLSIASLRHTLSLNPRLVAPMMFLGKAYLQQGKPALGKPYLQHAHALHPEDVEILLTLAKTEESLQQPEEAAATYEAAAKLAPDTPAPWFGLGVSSMTEITAAGRELATTRAHSVWARALYADELLAQGRSQEAMSTYSVIFGAGAGRDSATGMATATSVQAAILARSLLQMLDQPETFPMPAPSRVALRDLVRSLKESVPAGASTPCDGPVEHAQPLQVAACAYWAGNYEASSAASVQALVQSSNEPEALYWAVKTNERRAVAAFSRFEDLAPQSAATYDLVGDLYRRERQPDSAQAAYEKALAIDAHDPAAQLGSAAASFSQGDVDKALATAKDALVDRPDDAELNLLAAEALVARHNFTQASPYLGRCQNASPELMLRVHALLGRVYAEEGKPAPAIEQMVLALPGDQDGSLHFQLSRLYRKKGDVADAQKAEATARVLAQKRMANATVAVRETVPAGP